MDLFGKVALVTGAAGNLGSACAREMAREGARVVVSDLPGSARLEAVAAAIRDDGGEAVIHQGDIASETDVIALIQTATRSFGGVDVLVNTAAALGDKQRDGSLEAMTVDYWDRMMAVNLRGTMLCCKHALPALLSGRTGSIINFGSTAALLGDEGLIAYSTTKAAILGYTRAIATTYGKQGLRCNAVCPGSVWPDDWKARMSPEWIDLAERTRLTPRLGAPDDIAQMVVFLASEKAAYITGQTFVVDGGGTAHQPWVRVR